MAKPGPPLHHGWPDPAGQDVLAGAPGGAEWLAQRGIPRASPPLGGGAVAGDLGWFADPPPGRGKGILGGGDAREDSCGGIAPLCPGPQPGRRNVATPQARGDAQRSLPGLGRIAYGTSSGYRSLAAEKTSISVLLCWSQARVVKLYFFMQRSVDGSPPIAACCHSHSVGSRIS